MIPLLAAIGLLLLSGAATLPFGSRPRLVTALGAGGAVAACLVGLVPAVRGLAGVPVAELRLPWAVPGGSFLVDLDPLSAFFLLPILVVCGLAAVYGGAYLHGHRAERSLAPPWFFFNAFVAGMVLVTIARNAMLFVVAWEVMSLSAWFLVTFEHEKREVRRAGWYYLVAAHLGVACLLAFFLFLGRAAGSLDFDRLAAVGPIPTSTAAPLLVLALVGFGTKAGLVPLHVWLPEAHPAAPSHVSAVMSGVMIKLGLYGLLRALTFLGAPAAWWGPLFVALGLATAVYGVVLAIAQSDLKRALAYSSIENVGLILLSMGVGLWGAASGHPVVALLGWAGGLFHLWNHALMKSLLFLCAGCIAHGAGARLLERLGGLMRRMPVTGAAFAAGAAAMSALPPFNGFVSEWLIYMGLLRGGLDVPGGARIALPLVVGAVAFVGGLALVCFVRLTGLALLGEPRTDAARAAHEAPAWMTGPIVILLSLCAFCGVLPLAVVSRFAAVVQQVSGLPVAAFRGAWRTEALPLAGLGEFNALVWLALLLCAAWLWVLVRRRAVATGPTWGCGYLAPTARMQYTGASFSELMTHRVFPPVLRPTDAVRLPQGPFPASAEFSTQRADPFSQGVYLPLFRRWADRCVKLRWLQQGSVHAYLVYIVAFLLLLLLWCRR